MNTDLIEKRNERTRKRKQVKRKMDSIIGLSYDKDNKKALKLTQNAVNLSSNGTARLIDEGYIDNGFVIKKGTLEKYLNGKNQYVRGWEFDGEHWTQTEVLNLTDDFIGNVNLGHIDFSILPFELGRWTKQDLTLVKTENDRHALDVDLHLDEDSIIIKELKRQPFDIGISAEFWVHENVEDTEALSETLGYYLPVFDEIFIFAYGLVGECGNVNSSGLELNTKETEMPNEEIIKEIEDIEEKPEELEASAEAEATESEAEVELGAESEIEIPPTSEEETAEEVTAEENAEAEVEEAEVEEVAEEESADDEDESDEDNGFEETLAALQNQIESLTNTIKDLTEQNVALKKSNRKLSNKLQSEKTKREQFFEEAKSLSVVLLPDEDKKQEPKKEKIDHSAYYNGDGIGEL